MSDAEGTDARLGVEIRRGHATDEELAALIAVVTEEYAVEAAGAVAEEPARPSGWRLSQRGMRRPLRRDLGWGRFGG